MEIKTQKQICENEKATWNNNSNKKWVSVNDVLNFLSNYSHDCHYEVINDFIKLSQKEN